MKHLPEALEILILSFLPHPCVCWLVHWLLVAWHTEFQSGECRLAFSWFSRQRRMSWVQCKSQLHLGSVWETRWLLAVSLHCLWLRRTCFWVLFVVECPKDVERPDPPSAVGAREENFSGFVDSFFLDLWFFPLALGWDQGRAHSRCGAWLESRDCSGIWH